METPGKLPATAKENSRQLLIICGALMVGVTMFSLVMVVIVTTGGMEAVKKIPAEWLLGASGLGAAICFGAARILFRQRLQAMRQKTYAGLNEKLMDYRGAVILYFALCEGASLFSIICFFLTGHFTFFIITGLMLLAMFIKLPVKSRLISELQLDWQEQQELS